MPVDPQSQVILDLINRNGGPSIEELGPEGARALFVAMRSAPGTEVASVEDRTIPGHDGEIPVRIYIPLASAAESGGAAEGPFPLHVTYHGGGFVIGNLDTHHGQAQGISAGAGAVVVSVDYRLAPEHPYPAAPEDCYAATVWAAEHAAQLGADATKLTVGGDSAGGNLAAVVSTMARDRGGPPIRLQVLVYPVTHLASDTPSKAENAEGYLLTRSAMDWFHDCYLQGRACEPGDSPLLNPDLTGLPPALVITAEFDPLRDEGEAYAARMEDAGVPVTLTRYEGQIHGFASMASFIDAAKDCEAQITAAITDACR